MHQCNRSKRLGLNLLMYPFYKSEKKLGHSGSYFHNWVNRLELTWKKLMLLIDLSILTILSSKLDLSFLTKGRLQHDICESYMLCKYEKINCPHLMSHCIFHVHGSHHQPLTLHYVPQQVPSRDDGLSWSVNRLTLLVRNVMQAVSIRVPQVLAVRAS